MIFRAISSLMAIRDSLIFTMILPPSVATTVAGTAGYKAQILQMLLYFRLPPTFRMRFSSPGLASAKGIITSFLPTKRLAPANLCAKIKVKLP